MPVEELRAVARGRVWTGADALDRGLVDELGGLERSVEVACERAGLARAEVELRVVPKPKLFERLLPPDNSESPAAAGVLGEGVPVLDRLLATTGLAPYGVLSLPVTWRLQ
jgi:protease-4